MTGASLLLLGFVTAQRLGELVLARRNTKRLLMRGGVEYAPGHYPVMVALHAAWLIGLWLLAPGQPIHPIWLGVFLGLQALRVWVIATLNDRWTTRIVVVPGEARITRGPYRYLSHPNYVVVIGEIAVLPLVFGLGEFALIFSLLNGAVLSVRIRAENRALDNAETGFAAGEPAKGVSP